MNTFSQRSSIPSSIATGLIGWIGFMFLGPLIFGFTAAPEWQFLTGLVSALVQILVLRSAFFALQMQRHILVGALWGLLTAIGMYYATAALFPEMKEHNFYWILTYVYIGAPVGGFLSYFYIDDKKIFDENGGKQPDTDFGRDAHWMEPFGFGAAAYLIAYLPFAHLDLTVNVFIVGAISGVAAAGASHFSPDKWKNSFLMIALIIIVLGGIQGFVTGLLLRGYGNAFYADHLLLGILGGILTYTMTFIRGRYLANKEAAQS